MAGRAPNIIAKFLRQADSPFPTSTCDSERMTSSGARGVVEAVTEAEGQRGGHCHWWPCHPRAMGGGSEVSTRILGKIMQDAVRNKEGVEKVLYAYPRS